MSLGKTEQELKRNLEGIALDLKWSAVELKGIAHRLQDTNNHAHAHAFQAHAQALLRMVEVFERGESRLKVYADEVSAGHITCAAATEPLSGADAPY